MLGGGILLGGDTASQYQFFYLMPSRQMWVRGMPAKFRRQDFPEFHFWGGGHTILLLLR